LNRAGRFLGVGLLDVGGKCAFTLRCRSEAEASKGDGRVAASSFEARKSSHLRMTALVLWPDMKAL
jgi:hypothetical protein